MAPSAVAPVEGAERTGFEPADQFPGHRFSKPALSTTQPPLPDLNQLASTNIHAVGSLPGRHGDGSQIVISTAI